MPRQKGDLRILKCEDRVHCKACRTDADWRESVVGIRNFECPYGVTAKTEKDGSVKIVELSISARAKNLVKSAASGAASVVKTEVLRKDRASEDLYKERLNTCANCPGNHAVYKNGALYTCGKMLDSMTGQLPTCGCVLTKKARDKSQKCPMGYWKE